MEFIHKSVLFDEAIAALELSENKIVADGTAGRAAATRAKSQKKQKGLLQLTAIPMPLRFSASALRSLIM